MTFQPRVMGCAKKEAVWWVLIIWSYMLSRDIATVAWARARTVNYAIAGWLVSRLDLSLDIRVCSPEGMASLSWLFNLTAAGRVFKEIKEAQSPVSQNPQR